MPEDPSAQPYLMFRDPDGDMTRVALENLPLTLGRRSTNEVQVLDPTVSRDHARILRDNAEFVVEDLGSTHGTFVNQQRIERHVLGPNDRIRLGGATNHLLTFRSGGEFTMMIGTTGKATTLDGGNEIKEQQDSTRNLEALLEISKALNSSLRLNDVLEKVMDAVIALTEGERCMMLLGSEAESLEIAAQRNLTSDALSTQYSQSVVSAVFGNGQAQILTDVTEDEHFSAQQSIVGLHLRTVMCVPLRLSHFSRVEESDLGDLQSSDGADPSARILGVLYVDPTLADPQLWRPGSFHDRVVRQPCGDRHRQCPPLRGSAREATHGG
ncbi:MAG TPA: FHA domain-containing protein [Acidobacteriota bacterium]|nr:FHA domain-containing protein [Acidobacteriota bacterium]